MMGWETLYVVFPWWNSNSNLDNVPTMVELVRLCDFRPMETGPRYRVGPLSENPTLLL